MVEIRRFREVKYEKRKKTNTESGVRRKDKETLRRRPMWRPLHVTRQLGNDSLIGEAIGLRTMKYL
jgi:hypothetical protein